MTDYIEKLLEEQEEQEEQSFLRGTEGDGTGGGKMLPIGGPMAHPYGGGGETRTADTGTGGNKADAGVAGAALLAEQEGATLPEGAEGRRGQESPAALEATVLRQNDEKIGRYKVTGTGKAHRLYLAGADRASGAGAETSRETQGTGGSLRRRLQWAAAAAAYRAPLPEARGYESLAAESPSLLALDAAVQRDARRYDGGFELV